MNNSLDDKINQLLSKRGLDTTYVVQSKSKDLQAYRKHFLVNDIKALVNEEVKAALNEVGLADSLLERAERIVARYTAEKEIAKEYDD